MTIHTPLENIWAGKMKKVTLEYEAGTLVLEGDLAQAWSKEYERDQQIAYKNNASRSWFPWDFKTRF